MRRKILFGLGSGIACSVLMLALSATSAWATEYTIDGTAGNTLADVMPSVVTGDVIKVAGDQTTASSTISSAVSFIMQSNTVGVQQSISGNSVNRFFSATAALSIEATNVTFANGATSATGSGGALAGTKSVSITGDSVSFASNSAKNGGAIYAANALDVENATFTNNTASYQGGAIIIGSPLENISISNSSFTGNKSVGGSGGAIWAHGYDKGLDLELSNVSLENNSGTRGGAIFTYMNIELTGTNAFTGNRATWAGPDNFGNGGGAILAAAGVTTMSGTNTFDGNTSAWDGGAITAYNTLNISGEANFLNNTAVGVGGAIYSTNAVNFSGEGNTVTFSGNEVTPATGAKYGHDIYAGSVSITGSGTYTFGDSVWASNGSNTGRFVAEGSSKDAVELKVGSNAKMNVSGIGFGVISGDRVTLDNVSFSGNNVSTSVDAYGLVFANYGFDMVDVTVSDNTFTGTGMIQGIIKENTGNSIGSGGGLNYFTTIAGNSVFSGNKIESNSSLGGAIDSVAHVYFGATFDNSVAVTVPAGEIFPDVATGSDISFSNNTAMSTGVDAGDDAAGGAVASWRNMATMDGVKLSFDGNKAIANAGGAYGGAVAVMKYYGSAVAGDKGIDFIGDSATVTFKNNQADSNSGNGYGGAIASYDMRAAHEVQFNFGGDGSTYEFTNNSAKTAGGAIYTKEGTVNFSGNGASATFSGNTANGVANDIVAASVSFSGNGTYTLDGGINATNVYATAGANVSLLAGSISNIDHFEVDGAYVTIENGAKLTITGSSSLVVKNNGTLELGDSAAITSEGPITVDGTSTLVLGVNSNYETIVLSDETDMTVQSGAKVVFDFEGEYAPGENQEIILAETDGDIVIEDGVNVTYENAPVPQSDLVELVTRTTEDGRTQLVAKVKGTNNVPEPATWLMMLLGCAGMAYGYRRKHQAA